MTPSALTMTSENPPLSTGSAGFAPRNMYYLVTAIKTRAAFQLALGKLARRDLQAI